MKEYLKDLLWIAAVFMVAGGVWFVLTLLDRRLDDGSPINLPPLFF